MIDATIIEAPRQGNSREENATLKAGAIPTGLDDPEPTDQHPKKDTDARCTQKNGEAHYGCKNLISADAATKLIQGYVITTAQVLAVWSSATSWTPRPTSPKVARRPHH